MEDVSDVLPLGLPVLGYEAAQLVLISVGFFCLFIFFFCVALVGAWLAEAATVVYYYREFPLLAWRLPSYTQFVF